MAATGDYITYRPRILLIGPKGPPYGGMALQGEKLELLLGLDDNSVSFVDSNVPFPRWLRFMDHIRGVRPFARSAVISVKLWSEIRQADVVHVLAASWLYFFLVVAPAVVLSRVHHKRVVLNYRSGEGKQFFRRYGRLAAPIFRMADAVTAPSEFLAKAIQECFGVAVSIVPNILNLAAFRYRERNLFTPRLLVTRHLEKLYGVESVIQAFKLIQDRHPTASLRIAGVGSEEQNLRRLVTKWRLRNVQFLGQVPQRDLPAIHATSDIMLNGSLIDNFPGSLLEASASGLAIVSTSAGGIPFIYEDGKQAILVEPGDWRGLACGVEQILEDSSLGRELTSQAFQLCRQCEWDNVRRSLYRSYGLTAPGPDRGVGGISGLATANMAGTTTADGRGALFNDSSDSHEPPR